VDGVARVVRARARDHRAAGGLVLHRQLDDPQVLLVAQRRRLAGRPGDDDPVRARRADVLLDGHERVLVDAAVGVERGDDRGEDGTESGHGPEYRTRSDGVSRRGGLAPGGRRV
jgi:hypothetical protein